MHGSLSAVEAAATTLKQVKHKRRYCRVEGCTKIVKSQGLCQSHGAKPRKCKVDGCQKQAQGNFDGMCKSHFKAHRRETAPITIQPIPVTYPTSSSSSLSNSNSKSHNNGRGGGGRSNSNTVATTVPPNDSYCYPVTQSSSSTSEPIIGGNSGPSGGCYGSPSTDANSIPFGESVYDSILPRSIAWDPSTGDSLTMPLIAHLKDGFDNNKPSAWHRNEERFARGLMPITNPATQLEGWERELVWMEILVLSGVPGASFRHLARAWGRDKGTFCFNARE